MNEAQFRQELKSGLSGAYLLYGDEDYLKHFYMGRAESRVAGEGEAAEWNVRKIAAEKALPRTEELYEAVMSVPMFGDRVFVAYTADISSMTKDEQKTLTDIVSALDPDSTVLMICTPKDGFDAGAPEKNKPSALYKSFAKVCKPVDIPTQSPAELAKWMGRRLAKDKLTVAADASRLLTARIGRNMYALSGELDKLAAYALANGMGEIDSDTVASVSGTNEEEDSFALANAVLDGDRRKALSVLKGCKQRREEAPKVLGSVSRVLCDMLTVSALAAEGCDKNAVAEKAKMHPYRAGLYLEAVKDRSTEQIAAAVRRCREADVSIKSTSLEDYIAIERLVCTVPSKRRRVQAGVQAASGGAVWKK